jgi:hypothetical protein
MRPLASAASKAGLVAHLECQGHERPGEGAQCLGIRGTGRLGSAAASWVVMSVALATSPARWGFLGASRMVMGT